MVRNYLVKRAWGPAETNFEACATKKKHGEIKT